MQHYNDITDAQTFFECMAAPARVEILKLALSHKADSLDAIAKTLHISNGAVTQHIKKLCDAGLIKLVETPGKRGTAKHVVPTVDRVIIDIATDISERKEQNFDIALGSFVSAAIKPYCGIASTSGWIGERDDPRYFTFPERSNAALIYFNSGKIGWTLPAPARRALRRVAISLELSSKPYGHGQKRESTVSFFLGDIKLGEHAVDGEFTDRKGLFTPDIFDGLCQYGAFKTVTVDKTGAYFDGIKIGSATVADINPERFNFSLAAENGVAIFGAGCGDYDCGIMLKLEYED